MASVCNFRNQEIADTRHGLKLADSWGWRLFTSVHLARLARHHRRVVLHYDLREDGLH